MSYSYKDFEEHLLLSFQVFQIYLFVQVIFVSLMESSCWGFFYIYVFLNSPISKELEKQLVSRSK